MGVQCSPKCLAAVLGIGNERLQRLMDGQVDRRFAIWGGVPEQCLAFVLMILFRFISQ